MSAPQARQVDTKFYCPEEGCTKSYALPNILRKHCKDVHKTQVQRKQKEYDAERRKEQNRTATKRYREKKSCEKAVVEVALRRKQFTYKHAERRGGRLASDALLEAKASQIPGGGNGVFMCEDLIARDVVTWHTEKTVKEPSQDSTYTIRIKRGYLVGAQDLAEGVGLCSFVNREQCERGCRKNCEFVECVGEKHKVHVEITKTVKKGDELFTTYGHS